MTALLVVGVLALAAGYWWRVAGQRPAILPPPVRMSLTVPNDRRLDEIALSPDGMLLAYTAEMSDGSHRLFLRSVAPSLSSDSVADREVATDAASPFFSPDGGWLAYFTEDAIWKTRVSAFGDRQRVCDAPGEQAGGTWTGDGRIVFAPVGGWGLMVVPAAGGRPSALTTLNRRARELAHGWPHAVSGGGLIFTIAQGGRDLHLAALSAAGARVDLRMVPAMGQAQYEATGHLVYSYLGDVYAVAFDAHEMTVTGLPVALARGVQTSTGFGPFGRAGFALSPNGTLAWIRGAPSDGESEIVKTGYDGRVLAQIAPAARYLTPRLSPDGTRLAVVVRSGLVTRDLTIFDLAHPEHAPVVVAAGVSVAPAWMPDGRLSFSTSQDGVQKIFVVDPAATPPAQAAPLFSMDVAAARYPAAWTARPPLLALYEVDPLRAGDVMLYRVGEAIVPIAATKANERSPWLAPDGTSMAYVSDASGRDEVYVQSLDAGAGAAPVRQVSSGGGVEPVWTRDGLFYREGHDLLLDGTPAFRNRRFELDPLANAADYDVSASGQFLIMLRSARQPRDIRVVKEWGTELAQQVRPRD